MARPQARRLYLDCASGIAGDMTLAALFDAGLPAGPLERDLKSALKLRGWRLRLRRVQRGHAPALSLTITNSDRFLGGAGRFREIIARSRLPRIVKTQTLKALKLLWNAERRIHGRLPRGHEHAGGGLFSLDTLLDLAGGFWGIERMGVSAVGASPPNLGRAAPATLEIVKAARLPSWTTGEPVELTTPTGAALLATLRPRFGASPPMRIERSGLGAGRRPRPSAPNVLIATLGTPVRLP